ncbi:MAG: protein kinase, partial [Planctomycetes bacterium]|nr:protein kinase [Planctomycetota bacterium]
MTASDPKPTDRAPRPPASAASGEAPTLRPQTDPNAQTLMPQSDPNAPTLVPHSDPNAPTLAQPSSASRNASAATAAAATISLTGQIWGDFEFGELLGKGGMGVVYRGRQISLDRSVALKVLPRELGEDEQFRERFLREAKAVGRIASEHVVQVYFAGQHEGQHFYAMEYVDGKDLARRLKNGWRPTHAQARDIVQQAAYGLTAAGDLGLVHRDIKPGNLIMTGRGTVKLMDFGLVRLASDQNQLTRTGVVMGTVSYFSPEQGRGERTDPRSDLYSLGVVFFELLTGKLPFTGESATSVIYQHIHEVPKAPRDVDGSIPAAYNAIVMRCLEKRAERRYQSAAELVADLEGVDSGSRASSPLRLVAAALIGAALIAGSWWL